VAVSARPVLSNAYPQGNPIDDYRWLVAGDIRHFLFRTVGCCRPYGARRGQNKAKKMKEALEAKEE
jgi:hypothetical protein